MILGQDVKFVGFPLGLSGNVGEIFQNHPLPFVKSGIVSCMLGGADQPIVLDGLNVRGFSGGPFYFMRDGILKLGGIVSNYRHTSSPVLTKDGQETGEHVQVNSGIMLAYAIKHALDIIEEHGGGFDFPT